MLRSTATPAPAKANRKETAVELIIKGKPEEIASLVVAIQGRQEQKLSVKLSKRDSDDLVVEDDHVSDIIRAVLVSDSGVCQ